MSGLPVRAAAICCACVLVADGGAPAGPHTIWAACAQYIRREDTYGAHNYAPIPVVISKAEGVHVWDVDGKQYFDFLSAYSALNQGHNHPRVRPGYWLVAEA